jgi:hypothetical protein
MDIGTAKPNKTLLEKYPLTWTGNPVKLIPSSGNGIKQKTWPLNSGLSWRGIEIQTNLLTGTNAW